MATNPWRIRIGRVATVVPVLFLIFDGVIKLDPIAPVIESFNRLGFPIGSAAGVGILELACLGLYLIPRSSVLGALLLTGFLGGATAMHVRVGDPLFSHVLFPAYVGLLLWAGLMLRDERLPAVVLLLARRDSGATIAAAPGLLR